MEKQKGLAELRLIRVLSRMPYGLVIRLVRSLAWLASWLPLSVASAHRDIVVNYLACFPELSYREIRRRARRTLVETAHTLASYSHVWIRDPAETLARVRNVHGRDAFVEAMNSERPVVLMSLHHSSWEVPVLEIGTVGHCLIMYNPHENNAVDPVVKDGRGATGCELIPTTASGVKRSMQVLAKGGALGLLADHQPGDNNPSVPFFGYEVPVPAFVHKVASRFRPHLFYISALRVEDGQIDIFFEPLDDSLLDLEERPFLTEMMAGLERIIRRAPEQYNWTYKRFRRGPEGLRRRWYNKANAMARIQRAAAGEPLAGLFDEPV